MLADELFTLTADVQIDISAAGSLDRHAFSLALDRAGVSLEADDKNKLFHSLRSAGTGRGCDIEMFAYLVKFWAGYVNNNKISLYVHFAGFASARHAGTLLG